jgi:hypothetical protein
MASQPTHVLDVTDLAQLSNPPTANQICIRHPRGQRHRDTARRIGHYIRLKSQVVADVLCTIADPAELTYSLPLDESQYVINHAAIKFTRTVITMLMAF